MFKYLTIILIFISGCSHTKGIGNGNPEDNFPLIPNGIVRYPTVDDLPPLPGDKYEKF